MRIVYCIPGLYNSGGMERVLSAKANYLAERGYEVHIVTTEQRGQAVYFPLNEQIRLHHLEINYELYNGSLWGKISSFLFLQRKHRKALSALLGELKADITVSMFGNDEGILPTLRDGSKKVLEYHFSKLKRLQYGRRGLWRMIDEWRTRQDERVVRLYDRFVVLTQEDQELWGDLPNISVIPNPLPFDSAETATLRHHRIIAAGRYDYQKNFEELIDIWAELAPRYPSWRLDIYGDGAERPALEAKVRTLGLSNSLALRPATRDIATEYLQSSVYAMTSRYEGLPMVLIEAQTMGLPIVSYACQCGPRDIITDGVDGYLVAMGDRKTFAERLERLIQSEAERIALGEAARVASRRYQIEEIMPRWETLFTELVSR